ncbi:MAG: UDP-2,3-diacylglucosamine diphosphatase [Gammaproteobacteria bacterium]|nr:UDP-2,3-diacylglucosamine diphosphatase [Gammaproteobacteria bacterium]
MRHTLFIADLHLDEKHTLSTQLFNQFMDNHAPQAEAVYILGDFFELWIGDDHETPYISTIKRRLKSLTEKNIPVYFMRGNRDFLIGKRFAKQTGCKILAEHSIAQVYGEDVILLHGDSLCSLDLKHMKFRKLTNNLLLRALFLSLPLRVRKKIGDSLRQSSRGHHSIVPDYLDVVPETIDHIFSTTPAQLMVHGHIHKASVFKTMLDHKPTERIVLGAWEHQGCALKWYESGKKEMLFF